MQQDGTLMPGVRAPVAMAFAEGSATSRDPEAASYLDQSALPMEALVMGLFDSSDDCIKLIGRDGALKLMNCNGRQAMEIDDFAAVAGAQWHALWPEDTRETVRQSVAEALEGRRVRFEAFCPTAKGTPRWWEVTVAPIGSPGGGVEALLASSRDITDRMQREQALDTVAKEMRHRLRNAFAVSAAIANASGREAPEHSSFAEGLSRRLTSLAEAQTALLDMDGQAALAPLVHKVLAPSGDDSLTIGTLPDIWLGDAAAKALALALGELATNSLKYGALGTAGQVRVGGAMADDVLLLDWTETRGPREPALQAHPGSSGQGSMIIARMLASVGGSIDSGPTADGYRAAIRIARWQK